MPALTILKRDDNNLGYELPPPVIVLLIMFGAGFVTCLGYAVHKVWGFGDDPNLPKPVSVEQMEYMNEVKARNMEAIEYESRVGRRGR